MQDWVLFVPGFAASHLFRLDTGGDRMVKIWLSQTDIAWNGIGQLDTDADISPTDLEHVRPGGPLMEVYQPFYAHLAMKGIPVANFGYDWRADVATNGQRLADYLLRESTPNTRWTIITHSAGGLVAASAINRLAASIVPKVAALITCATPWHGSYRSMEMMAGAHETIEEIVNLNRVFSRRSKNEWLMQTVRVVAGWPGLYDLMPMPELMLKYPPAPGQDFISDGVFEKVNPWFSLAKYNQAVARRPIHAEFPPSIVHHNFRGIGRPTPGPSPTMYNGYPDHWPVALLGDTTVPEFSSLAPAVFNATDRQFDADHEQFMNDWRVMGAINAVMGIA